MESIICAIRRGEITVAEARKKIRKDLSVAEGRLIRAQRRLVEAKNEFASAELEVDQAHAVLRMMSIDPDLALARLS